MLMGLAVDDLECRLAVLISDEVDKADRWRCPVMNPRPDADADADPVPLPLSLGGVDGE